ncbi:MAG: DegV family protein [Dehalococcoidia bacterium]|nr:MAG: DegV family protein [Dehalococcoidia bacterium]
MGNKVSVVTDSISCLPKDLVKRYNIGIVPIRLLVQGKTYRDSEDITPTEAYKLFLQDPESFNTTPASPGHYLEAYRTAVNGTKDILCVTLSSKLSTGYDMARVAKEQARTELPQTNIEVLDSHNVTAAEGFVALAGARAAAEGKGLAEAIKEAKQVREKVTFLAFLDTIRYVYRTGRIPKMAAQFGSILKIKPILTSSGGLIKFKGIVRNREQGENRLLEIMRNKVGSHPVHVGVMHAFAPDEASRLKKRIASEFHCSELWISEFTPVMGYATGTGTLGLAFYSDN